MSLKSKRTTADKDPNGDYPEKRDLESGNGLEPKILFSSSKMLKKLSLSFYGEDTMRKQKQVIYDQEQFESNSPRRKTVGKSKQNKIVRKNYPAAFFGETKQSQAKNQVCQASQVNYPSQGNQGHQPNQVYKLKAEKRNSTMYSTSGNSQGQKITIGDNSKNNKVTRTSKLMLKSRSKDIQRGSLEREKSRKKENALRRMEELIEERCKTVRNTHQKFDIFNLRKT